MEQNINNIINILQVDTKNISKIKKIGQPFFAELCSQENAQIKLIFGVIMIYYTNAICANHWYVVIVLTKICVLCAKLIVMSILK